jgi:GAF domain-containing protein
VLETGTDVADTTSTVTDAVLIENLPDPVLLLFSGGETERANTAARELATAHGLRQDLVGMFGKDGAALLDRARREGTATGFLPLRVTESEPLVHRVTIRRAGTTGRYVAMFTDMSREFRWRDQLGARNREMGVLNDIGAALSASLELDTLAERIYTQVGRILDTTNFYIALHDREADTIEFMIRVERRERLPRVARRPAANGVTEHVIRTGKPLLVNGDVIAETRAMGLHPIGRPATSWLGVPLLAEGQAFGMIALQDHDGVCRFEEHDLEVLTLIAGQAAAAVRNAQLLEEARTAYRTLRETQQSLLEAERQRSITETVGALNHEVNNPLATIAGNAQLLMRKPDALPEGAGEKIQRILEAAKRIQGVTSKMANLIHATSMRYPGNESILDISRSTAREEPGPPSTGDGTTEAA